MKTRIPRQSRQIRSSALFDKLISFRRLSASVAEWIDWKALNARLGNYWEEREFGRLRKRSRLRARIPYLKHHFRLWSEVLSLPRGVLRSGHTAGHTSIRLDYGPACWAAADTFSNR